MRGLNQKDFRLFEDGTAQEISSFDASATPASIALVIDASPSIFHELAEMRGAAHALAENLSPADQIAVVSFSDEAHLLLPFSTDRRLLDRAIESKYLARVENSSESQIYQSVFFSARELFSGRTGRKAIVLLTDGQDSGLGLTWDAHSAEPGSALQAPRLAFDDVARELGADGIALFIVSTENRPRGMTPEWLEAHRAAMLVTQEARQANMPHYTLYLAELARRVGGRLYFLRETGILTSASDYHIFNKLKKTRRAAMNDYLEIVNAALDAGLKIRCHLEDATRADFYGFVVPFVSKLMELGDAAGLPVKIRVCDTLGFGVPYPGVALPRSVPKLILGLRKECGVKPDQLEWHGHNDFHKVLANATAAWLYGCMYANGTILGYGERTGNPPLEGLVMDYVSLKGDTNGMDLSVITEIAEYFEREAGYKIPANYPFVGRDFNVTRAGIHADGLLKDEEIYNVFDTAQILRRPPRVAVDKTSGAAGIAWWINAYFSLPRDRQVEKRSPEVAEIAKWVDAQYDDGRTTSISDEEMAAQARKHLPRLFEGAQSERLAG